MAVRKADQELYRAVGKGDLGRVEAVFSLKFGYFSGEGVAKALLEAVDRPPSLPRMAMVHALMMHSSGRWTLPQSAQIQTKVVALAVRHHWPEEFIAKIRERDFPFVENLAQRLKNSLALIKFVATSDEHVGGSGDSGQLERLLEKGTLEMARDCALLTAVKRQHYWMEYLLDAGVSKAARGQAMTDCLRHSESDLYPQIDIFLAEETPVAARDLALLLAIRKKFWSTTGKLLDAGISPEGQAAALLEIVAQASCCQASAVARRLLENGLPLAVRNQVFLTSVKNPHCADISMALLKAGVSAEMRNTGLLAIRKANKDGFFYDHLDRVTLVKKLLEQGTSRDVRNEAVRAARQDRIPLEMELLIAAGVDTGMREATLIDAVRKADCYRRDIVPQLLKAGVSRQALADALAAFADPDPADKTWQLLSTLLGLDARQRLATLRRLKKAAGKIQPEPTRPVGIPGFSPRSSWVVDG